MEIKLIVSGKEIKAQISDEDLQRIQQKNTESRFERCSWGEKYYFSGESGVSWHPEATDSVDIELFSTGNYFIRMVPAFISPVKVISGLVKSAGAPKLKHISALPFPNFPIKLQQRSQLLLRALDF